MYGLRDNTIEQICTAIAGLPAIERVLLYGSRAKGNYHPGSDIDMTLLGPELDWDNSLYPLMEALEQLNLAYTFDITLYDSIENPDLKQHIQQVGQVFYQRGKRGSGL